MLKSKAGFKPKAKAVPRRNAPASSSQAPESTEKASTAETRLSNTPIPTPPPVDQGVAQPQPPPTSALPTAPVRPSTVTPPPTQHTVSPSSQVQAEKSQAASTQQTNGHAEKVTKPNEGQSPIPSVRPSGRVQPGEKETFTDTRSAPSEVPIITPTTSTATAPRVQPSTDGSDTIRHVSQPTKAPADATPQNPQSSAETIVSAQSTTPSTPSSSPRTRATRSTPQSTLAGSSAAPPTQPTANSIEGEPQPSVEGAATSATGAPPGTSKAKRPRKRKADNTTTDVSEQDGEQNGPVAPPTKRPRAKRTAPLPGEEGYEPNQTAKPTRTRKRKTPATDTEGTGEDGEAGSAAPKKRQREATPEDAEAVKVDVTQVKMADLAKDMHIGKKFSLHDKLLEQERMKRQKANEKKKQKRGGAASDVGEEGEQEANGSASKNDSTPEGTAAQGGDNASDEPSGRSANQLAPVGEQYQIVDGVIVVDARSLQVDRHARAAEEAGELEEHEENEFTNHITSATYLRRNLKPQQWTEEETEMFFQALSAWGADFETISKIFPNKTRKHVKLKYNREERTNPKRIDEALIGKKTVSMDLEEYMRHTGQEYETAEAIYAEEQKRADEFEARQQAIKDQAAEEARKKREELFGGGKSGGGGADGVEEEEDGGGKKKRGRGKKAKVSHASL